MTRPRRIARIESNMDSSLAQGILLLIAFHLHYRKSYVWVIGAEGLQQGWQDAGGERRDIRQTKLDARSLMCFPRAPKRLLRTGDCPPRFNQKGAACIGQAHPLTTLSLKKLDSKFIFQSSNLAAGRWQAYVQTPSRAPEG